VVVSDDVRPRNEDALASSTLDWSIPSTTDAKEIFYKNTWKTAPEKIQLPLLCGIFTPHA
jgi:hypothetical protein